MALKAHGPLIIVLVVILLSLALAAATLILSQRYGLDEGYIPPEERDRQVAPRTRPR
ncbi:MAG: hypothetical protein ACFCGT_12415 [Sandaracinaceae bacterium]